MPAESLFSIKLQTDACSFIKKETLAQVFSCEFSEISKNTFFYRTLPVAASDYSLLLYFCVVCREHIGMYLTPNIYHRT